jgi:hypothetical protein
MSCDSDIRESFLGSQVLGLTACEKKAKPATALHEVGTWRKPVDPSCATKVRLVDAAIQAFSSTFGLKSGKEQQKAMDNLQALLPPAYFHVGRSLGSTDQDRTGKVSSTISSRFSFVPRNFLVYLTFFHTANSKGQSCCYDKHRGRFAVLCKGTPSG